MPQAKSSREQTVSVLVKTWSSCYKSFSLARGTAAELFMALAAERETDYKIKLL